jgi:hypothetical protein
LTGVDARAARTGGAGGRREGEKSGRAWVSLNSPSAVAHSGLPASDTLVAPTRDPDGRVVGTRSSEFSAGCSGRKTESRAGSCAAAAITKPLSSAATGAGSPDFLIVSRLLVFSRRGERRAEASEGGKSSRSASMALPPARHTFRPRLEDRPPKRSHRGLRRKVNLTFAAR